MSSLLTALTTMSLSIFHNDFSDDNPDDHPEEPGNEMAATGAPGSDPDQGRDATPKLSESPAPTIPKKRGRPSKKAQPAAPKGP